jgi:hypothetical protein
MSDLTIALQSAIVSLTEARNFLLGMGDFIPNYADDIEAARLEKREKMSAQEKEEQILSSDDESTATFAYMNLLPDGFLMMLFSLFDECLFNLSSEVARRQSKPLNYDRGKSGRFTADQSFQFLTDIAGIQVADRCPSWEKVKSLRRLRDIVVTDHHHVREEYIPFLQSLAQSNRHFSYKVLANIYHQFDFDFDFLVDLCKTMLSFFRELEKPISEIER